MPRLCEKQIGRKITPPELNSIILNSAQMNQLIISKLARSTLDLENRMLNLKRSRNMGVNILETNIHLHTIQLPF